MTAPDGKMRLTDVADVEQLFRLVQSIPSPKAEPFKLWLSSLARERLEEIDDPEQGIDRMLEYYHRKGCCVRKSSTTMIAGIFTEEIHSGECLIFQV